jgi:hypothetical protein
MEPSGQAYRVFLYRFMPILFQPVIATGFLAGIVKILPVLPSSATVISNGCQKACLKKEKSLLKKSGKS